jgi:hypothetical protein
MAATDLFPLDDEGHNALTALLRREVHEARYPLSPRIRTLRGILERLEPPEAERAPEPLRRHHAPPAHGRAAARPADGPGKRLLT